MHNQIAYAVNFTIYISPMLKFEPLLSYLTHLVDSWRVSSQHFILWNMSIPNLIPSNLRLIEILRTNQVPLPSLNFTCQNLHTWRPVENPKTQKTCFHTLLRSKSSFYPNIKDNKGPSTIFPIERIFQDHPCPILHSSIRSLLLSHARDSPPLIKSNPTSPLKRVSLFCNV